MSPTARSALFMLVALVVLGVVHRQDRGHPDRRPRASRLRVQAAFPSVAGLDEKSAGADRRGAGGHRRDDRAEQGRRALVTLSLDPGVAAARGRARRR